MTEYTPDRWMLIKVTGADPHYRVFGSWFGGYLGSDSWRLNSGIVSVTEEDESYIFRGHSGSVYRCYKEAYGSHTYGYGVASNLVEKSGGHMEIINEMPDIMEIERS